MKELELTLLYLLKDGQILLAMKKRGFGIGKWNGVGGKVEPNESIEEALERECFEEIDVRISQYKKVGFLIFNELHEQERKIMKLHVYTATGWEGEPTETEEMKPGWFSVNDIPFSKMWPADKIWLPKVLSGKTIEGTFTLDENESVREHAIKEVSSHSL